MPNMIKCTLRLPDTLTATATSPHNHSTSSNHRPPPNHQRALDPQSRVITNIRNSNTPRHSILPVAVTINPADGTIPAVDILGTRLMESTLRVSRDIRRAELQPRFTRSADTLRPKAAARVDGAEK